MAKSLAWLVWHSVSRSNGLVTSSLVARVIGDCGHIIKPSTLATLIGLYLKNILHVTQNTLKTFYMSHKTLEKYLTLICVLQ